MAHRIFMWSTVTQNQGDFVCQRKNWFQLQNHQAGLNFRRITRIDKRRLAKKDNSLLRMANSGFAGILKEGDIGEMSARKFLEHYRQ